MKCILSIDAGTTSNRVVVFNDRGDMVHSVAREFPQIYPQPGWVEHDGAIIWQDVRALLQEAWQFVRAQGGGVAAIGITNQRESVALWDVSGKLVHNVIVWQDRRGAEICEELAADGMADYIHETTGLIVDAYFSASKLAWLFREYPALWKQADDGALRFGTIDSWLLYNLTGGAVHATDYSNASRTMMYDIQKLQWDQRMLSALRIPSAILPTVLPSSHIYGHTAADILDGEHIPIGGIAGDQQAALCGQACFYPGMAKNTYGTGSFALLNIGTSFQKSTHKLLTTIAWGIGDSVTYALEGSIFITGAAIQWLRDGIGIVKNASQSEALVRSIESNHGVYFVPAFVGLGAPHWDAYARGMIIGITGGTGRAEIVRATLESLAYQSREVLDAMVADSGTALTELRVDGGAVVNDFLMQFQADMLNTTVIRPTIIESTARGSAFLAGLAVGMWNSLQEISSTWKEERRFTPTMAAEQRTALFTQWQQAVARAKNWVPLP